jgi:hypothetical protein
MWKCACGNDCDDDSCFCGKCGLHKLSQNWYYIDNGIRYGPFSMDDMKSNVLLGKINANTSVWSEGFSEWKEAKSTILNQFIITVVPPVASSELSDKWAWTLASVPILVNIMLFEFGLSEPLLTMVVSALNCIFLFLDIGYLKKVKEHPGKWIYLGLLLVPVYLFIRASKTTKKYGYAIVWCVLFFLSILPIW